MKTHSLEKAVILGNIEREEDKVDRFNNRGDEGMVGRLERKS